MHYKEDVNMNTNKKHLVVDKTMMIEEYLERQDTTACIVRPPKFGKTYNHQMLTNFLDITKDCTTAYQSAYIANTPYWKQRNQAPVIALSFQNAKCDTVEQCLSYIKKEIKREIRRHQKALSLKVAKQRLTLSASKDENILVQLLYFSEALYAHYQSPVHIIIDDYDIPLRYAKRYGYQSALSECFDYQALHQRKTDACLLLLGTEVFFEQGEITFYTLKEEGYWNAFGFTRKEIEGVFAFSKPSLYEQLTTMYGGFLIGGRMLYQPYAIVCYYSTAKRILYTPYRSISKHLIEEVDIIDEMLFTFLNELCAWGKAFCTKQIFSRHISLLHRLWMLGYICIVAHENGYFLNITNQETKIELQYLYQKLKERDISSLD